MSALNLIDWYKADHRRQYVPGTELVFSNFTPRSSRIEGINHIIFFGLQYFIKKYLIKEWNESFFNQPKEVVLQNYRRRVNNALGKDAITYEHIEELHDLGYLPIKIMALPEGSKVPIGVPPFVVFNTKESGYKCSWLVNYLETILSCTVWQACTSATLAREFRKEFIRAARETGGSEEFTQFQGHDFSFRGMSSLESAVISGMAHLTSFAGTDTVPAIDGLEEWYNADSDLELVGVSVPATEHSVMCMGLEENEIDTITRILDLYPNGIVSVVCDTWDYWNVLTNILPKLKDRILSRNGKFVVRPDSSPKTPFEIICGDVKAQNHYEYRGSIEVLGGIFGYNLNRMGYKELDPHIGLIYGDSITLDLARKINKSLKDKIWASTNWVAGIGSYTYQLNTRDTFGFAMKATFGVVNGEDREIFKNPKTNIGKFNKKSAKGLVAVYREGDTFRMKDQATWDEVNNCAFKTVFVDSRMSFPMQTSLKEIRQLILES